MLLELTTHLDGPGSNDHVLINVKKQAISISINTFTVYTFDLKGRLITALNDGHSFRRSLNNEITERWSVATNGHLNRVRLRLNWKKKQGFLNQAHYLIWKLYCIVEQNQFQVVSTNEEKVGEAKELALHALGKILFYDYFQLENDAKNFASIYRPVGILPPDMYLSVVLQATEGCSYNRCNYCHFYKDQKYRPKSEPEFRQHINEVKRYFGESIALRRFLFLGEANALDLPMGKLLPLFGAIDENFLFETDEQTKSNGSYLPRFRGIYGFLTPFHKHQKSAEEFGELQALHLNRIYIGMESGCNDLLRFLDKPSSSEKILKLVWAAKEGGVHVGIIILLGAGGHQFYDAHVRETVAAIKHMYLGKDDIIYFSPLIPLPGTAYARKVYDQNISILTSDELDQQRKILIDEFGFKKENTPKIALYDINEFIY